MALRASLPSARESDLSELTAFFWGGDARGEACSGGGGVTIDAVALALVEGGMGEETAGVACEGAGRVLRRLEEVMAGRGWRIANLFSHVDGFGYGAVTIADLRAALLGWGVVGSGVVDAGALPGPKTAREIRSSTRGAEGGREANAHVDGSTRPWTESLRADPSSPPARQPGGGVAPLSPGTASAAAGTAATRATAAAASARREMVEAARAASEDAARRRAEVAAAAAARLEAEAASRVREASARAVSAKAAQEANDLFLRTVRGAYGRVLGRAGADGAPESDDEGTLSEPDFSDGEDSGDDGGATPSSAEDRVMEDGELPVGALAGSMSSFRETVDRRVFTALESWRAAQGFASDQPLPSSPAHQAPEAILGAEVRVSRRPPLAPAVALGPPPRGRDAAPPRHSPARPRAPSAASLSSLGGASAGPDLNEMLGGGLASGGSGLASGGAQLNTETLQSLMASLRVRLAEECYLVAEGLFAIVEADFREARGNPRGGRQVTCHAF